MSSAAASRPHDLPVREQALATHRSTTAFLGMVIFMASWALLFAGLFFAYGLVRAGARPWPPTDLPDLPLMIPGLGTVALALSSVCLQRALHQVRRGGEGAPAFLIGATALGSVFLALQIHVWQHLWLLGLTPSAGPYASVFYGLTVFHALHVVVGLFALTYVAVQAARARYSASAHIPLRLWSLYWHMVGVVWGLMYVLLYIL